MPIERMEPPANIDTPTVHHVSAARKRRRSPGSASMQLNLTAMIDVVFLLLIYFVISAGFSQPEGVLTTNLPAGSSKKTNSLSPPSQKLKIDLLSEGVAGCQIVVAGQRVGSFTALAKALAKDQYDPKHGRTSGTFQPGNPVVIIPQGNVRWQHVVNAFNAAVKERYTNVAFARAVK